jgi:hypothetical protein
LFQLLIDHSDINALNALYVSIYLGITLKFLWAWSVEYSFIGSLSNPARTKIIHPFVFLSQEELFTWEFYSEKNCYIFS